jgi:zinc protease
VPITYVAFDFDAGVAADPQGGFGTQRLMLSDDDVRARAGATRCRSRSSRSAWAPNIGAFGTLDRSTVTLTTLSSANLGLSLDLFADMVHAAGLRLKTEVDA